MSEAIAIVTGATGDIGRAIVTELVFSGYHVIGVGRNKNTGSDLKNILGAENFTFLNADVSDEKQVKQIFENIIIKNAKISCLVACAGILHAESIYESRSWKETIDVNLSGTFYFFKYCIEKIRDDGNAANLFSIGSRWGQTGHSNSVAYSSSKASLTGFIKSVQLDLIGSNIKAFLISPGSVAGKMSDKVDSSNASPYIDPKQIAKLITFIIKCDANVIFDEITIKAYPYDYIN